MNPQLARHDVHRLSARSSQGIHRAVHKLGCHAAPLPAPLTAARKYLGVIRPNGATPVETIALVLGIMLTALLVLEKASGLLRTLYRIILRWIEARKTRTRFR